MKKFIPYILIAWTLLIFVGYNVLSAEAEKKDCSSITEPDDDFYCDQFDWGAYTPEDKQSVDEGCDASEDYAKNPKNCDIAYELAEKYEKNKKKDLKEACEKAGGKMENGYCDVKSSDVKQDRKNNEREWYYNENTNQYEYLSDEEIKEHNMEAESEIMQGENWGPETPIEPPSEPYPTTEEEEVIEDWGNEVEQPDYAASFKTDYSGEEKNIQVDDDEGKRYVNPDGGAPLYEDELTEDEKNYYEEYKPEKEKVEDWKNEVEPIREDKIASPIFVKNEDYDSEENVDRSYEYEGENESTETKEEQEFEEEEFKAEEEDDNQVNSNTEDSSDNTDSSYSQDSSDSEDNSSEEGGDSSDSGDDSSSSDDNGDSGDSSES